MHSGVIMMAVFFCAYVNVAPVLFLLNESNMKSAETHRANEY